MIQALTQMVNGDQSHFTKEHNQSEALAKAAPGADPIGLAFPSPPPLPFPAPTMKATTMKTKTAKERKHKDSTQTLERKEWFTNRLRAIHAAGASVEQLAERFKVRPPAIKGWLAGATFPTVEARIRMRYDECGFLPPIVDESHSPTLEGDECKNLAAWRERERITPDQAGAVLKMGGSTWLGFEGSKKDRDGKDGKKGKKAKKGTKNKFIASVLFDMMSGKTKWDYPPHEACKKTKGHVQSKANQPALETRRTDHASTASTPIPANIPTAVTPVVAPAPAAPAAAPAAAPVAAASAAPVPGRLSAKVKETTRKWIDEGKIASLDQLREATTLLAEILD